MKKLLALGSLATILSLSAASLAEESQRANPPVAMVGASFDLSVPSGASLGLEATSPRYFPYAKVGLAATYLFGMGWRSNLLVDPINFPVAPVADFAVGHEYNFTVPGVANSPTANFSYEDVMGGLALGHRDGARFLLLAGATHLNGNVYDLSKSVSVGDGISLGNPRFSVWAPAVKLGFEVLF
jgi:hypothetical protein